MRSFTMPDEWAGRGVTCPFCSSNRIVVGGTAAYSAQAYNPASGGTAAYSAQAYNPASGGAAAYSAQAYNPASGGGNGNPAPPPYPNQVDFCVPAQPPKASSAPLWLGVLSLVLWIIPLFGFPVAIAGIIVSSSHRRIGCVVMGIIGLILTTVNFVLGVVFAVMEN